jgi:hypothetical protein
VVIQSYVRDVHATSSEGPVSADFGLRAMSDLSTKADAPALRQKLNFLNPFNLICAVQSRSKIFSTLPVGQIISTSPRHPVSQEGRLAIVTDVETGCGGRKLRY